MKDLWSYVEDGWEDGREGSKKYKGLKVCFKIFHKFGLSDPTQC